MQSTVTIEIFDDQPLKSVLNFHKAMFDFSFAMLEFYDGKAMKQKASLWAFSANICRAPLLALTLGELEMLIELSATSREFADKVIDKWKPA